MKVEKLHINFASSDLLPQISLTYIVTISHMQNHNPKFVK